MKPVTLMLVDDNPRFLSAASSFLGEVDNFVLLSTLEGGSEAVAKATELQPDVILVDLAMPDIAGLQLIPMLRESIPDIGIVALTVHDNPQYQEAALNAGADAFITKSAILKLLEPTIKEVRGKRGTATTPATPAPTEIPTTPIAQENDYPEKAEERREDSELPSAIKSPNPVSREIFAETAIPPADVEAAGSTPPEKSNGSADSAVQEKSEIRILVMDDDPGIRNIYKKALNHKGYEIDLASNLDEARKLLNEYFFNVFICDIHVGNERGTDLLAEVGTSLKAKGTQIIMASAYGQYRYMAEDYGSEYFLEKPVSIHTLVTLIERVLEDSQSNLTPSVIKTGAPAT